MAVNDLTMNQIATIANEVCAQATGKRPLASVSSADFVTLGQTTLKCGYDVTLNAISQVMTRTVFSIRPYSRKFKGMQVTNTRFGNAMRKLNISDSSFQNDDRYTLVDGASVDQMVVKKANVLQTNFYGANVVEFQSPTIFKDQLDQAFTSADELGRFWTMLAQNTSDQIEQMHEALARSLVSSVIAGKVAQNVDVIHLISEYNSEIGASPALTKQDIMKPANFKPFMQWAYARIASVSALMTERSLKFHTNVTDKEIMRHTPYARQRVYTYAPKRYQMEAMVLADAYHDNYLQLADTESVNFWQSINTPDTIVQDVAYLKADGTIFVPSDGAEPTTVGDVFAVIMDEETAMYDVVNAWSAPTPFNAKGGYSNIWWHFTDRYLRDDTENAVVFLMD